MISNEAMTLTMSGGSHRYLLSPVSLVLGNAVTSGCDLAAACLQLSCTVGKVSDRRNDEKIR